MCCLFDESRTNRPMRRISVVQHARTFLIFCNSDLPCMWVSTGGPMGGERMDVCEAVCRALASSGPVCADGSGSQPGEWTEPAVWIFLCQHSKNQHGRKTDIFTL